MHGGHRLVTPERALACDGTRARFEEMRSVARTVSFALIAFTPAVALAQFQVAVTTNSSGFVYSVDNAINPTELIDALQSGNASPTPVPCADTGRDSALK